MNKKKLEKDLHSIYIKYIALNEEGEIALKQIDIKQYVNCLGQSDLEGYLLKSGLSPYGSDMKNELNCFSNSDGIVRVFQCYLETLAENELIVTKELKKQRVLDEKYQKQVSKAVIEAPCKIASANIGLFYTQQNFSDSDKKCIKGLDTPTIADALEAQETLLAKGDLTSLENMLLSQSHILNTIFTDMVSKMVGAKHLHNLEVYGRIALKAQNQTRQTASTLAEIKGIKKTTFIHQLNQGINQQVNNGAGENLTNTTNEKVLNNVDRRSEATRERQNKQDKTLALPENTGG